MRKMLKSKKGTSVFDNISAMGIGIMGLAIILVVGFLIMSTARTEIGSIEGKDMTNQTQMSTSVALNATQTLTNAIGDIPGWVPIIVITAIGSILIGMVAMFRRR